MTTTVDLSGFAPQQPFPDLPRPGFETYYGLECCDMGEAGDMVIIGHVGVLRAVAVFRKRLRELLGRNDADDTMCESLMYSMLNIEHLWAVRVARCATYPMCRSLGPVDDGKPCHDDGAGHDDHDWSEWGDRPVDVGWRREMVVRLRWCYRCNLYEGDPPRTVETNRCTQCVDIDDCGDFYLNWGVAADTPGAFPITLWRG